MIFPYLSLYLVLFSFICFILFILCPYPHGKFSYALPLSISSDVAWAMINIPTLICIFGYWDIENAKWVSDVPNTKGWICLSFFILHFVWRGIVSILWINLIHSENSFRGSKQTSFLLVLASWFYYPFVGMLIRYMCVHIENSISIHDILFLVCCFLFLGLNAYVDILFNYSRKTSLKTQNHEQLGIYLTKEGIADHFKVLVHLNIESPNYFFEMIEWGFFVLLTLRFEALWWFIATLLMLLPRALWTSHWYSECTDSLVYSKPSLKMKNTMKNIPKQKMGQMVF